MKATIILLPLLLIILTGCSNPKHPAEVVEISNKPYHLKLIKEKEILLTEPGNPALYYLNNPDHITVSFSGKDTVFQTFDKDLNPIKNGLIRYGEGPIENLSCSIIGGDESNIIVYDAMTQRYFIYNDGFTERKPLHSKQKGWIPHGANYSIKRKTIVSCYEETQGVSVDNESGGYLIVHLRKITGNRVDDSILYKAYQKMYLPKLVAMCANIISFRLIGDYVYILKKDDYRLMKFDLDGRLLKEIQVKGWNKVQFSKNEINEWIGSTHQKYTPDHFTYPDELWPANSLIEIGEGIAVIRINHYNSNNKKDRLDADYFSKDLKFLGKIQVPWFPMCYSPEQIKSELYFCNVGNMLYFLDTRETEEDEEIWLTRWRVEK